VSGTVTDAGSGQPVDGARVSAPALALTAVTDGNGRFDWPEVPLPAILATTGVVVDAGGYGTWTLTGARVLANDTLLISAALRRQAVTVTAPVPRAQQPNWPADVSAEIVETDTTPPVAPQAAQPLPATIRVRVTGYAHCDLSRPYTVETIDFREYAKHVLPNEWIASWNGESLRAGAMAAKSYAWYWAARGGKWPDADVYDSTCDQVYNPSVAYASTNAAVDATWNWRLTRNGILFQAAYRAYSTQCTGAGLAGNCMGQWDSQWMAQQGAAWSDILAYFYQGSSLGVIEAPVDNFALRFHGNAQGDADRLTIPVDDPASSAGGPPADVGATDFTLEFWMRANLGDNQTGPVLCGPGDGGQAPRQLFDRGRLSGDRQYNVGVAGGALVVRVGGDDTGSYSLCGQAVVMDGAWHHVAAERRRADGFMWLWVDGKLDAQADGPDGDISYPDAAVPPYACGPAGTDSCDGSEPYLFVGSPKRLTGQAQAGFNGWLDEIRLSTELRYLVPFTPKGTFIADAATAALYHFEDPAWLGPCTGAVQDSSAGAPGAGICQYGGSPQGPEWARAERKWWDWQLFLPGSLR
ncbi:MAG: SpoIID/LytB domain-containing protein, partial [Anaerolineales bacterium]